MSRLKTEARSAARRLGITRAIRRAQSLRGRDYEQQFTQALRDAVRPGDAVWDVGANVGFYTALLSDWVGENGQIVAIEPVPATFQELEKRFAGTSNVRLVNVGLGSSNTTLPLAAGDNPINGGQSFLQPLGDEFIELPVWRGDDLRAAERLPDPNVMKIDVEGFEQDALEGLGETLRGPSLRAVAMEIHFALLESVGRKHGPDEIVALLEGLGFAVRWTDASHLVATR